MPRGVYTRKVKVGAHKHPKASSPGRKKAVKKAVKKAARKKTVDTVEKIPSISLSSLKSSISKTKTSDEPTTIRTVVQPILALVPEPAPDTVLDASDVRFAIYGSDANNDHIIDWGDHLDDYRDLEAAERQARSYVEDDGITVYVVQVIAKIERTGLSVKRAAPKL